MNYDLSDDELDLGIERRDEIREDRALARQEELAEFDFERDCGARE